MEIDEYLKELNKRFKLIKPNEFYLSYSGGKDSHFLYWFIKEYAKIDGIEIVGVDTFLEHDEILARINKNCDVVLKAVLDPFEIKKRYGIPCFTKWQDSKIYRYQNGSRSKDVMRAVTRTDVIKFKLNMTASELVLSNKLHKVSNKCDLYNKLIPIKHYEKQTGKKGIIGVRGAESLSRKAVYTSCFNSKGNFTPIYDLTNEMINAIYDKYNIEIPSLYKYLDRTGCMGCPYGWHYKNTYKELALLPVAKREKIIELFKESYEVLGIDYKNIKSIDYYMNEYGKCKCLTCGKLFVKSPSSKGMYCCKECQFKSMETIKLYSVCKVCGKHFIAHHNSKGLFCSWNCSATFRKNSPHLKK